MINATGKTLSDYFSEAGREFSSPVSNAEPDGSFGTVFKKILSTRADTRGRHTGLTIKDYFAVVRSKTEDTAVSRPPDGNGATSSRLDVNRPSSEKAPALSSQISDRPALMIEKSIQEASRKYDLPEALIRSVIRHESNFRTDAVSRAGAQGLMQLMPDTAKALGVKNPFDARQNIDGGTRYLRQMVDLFDGDLEKALAAYNAGPGRVKQYNGVPPYRETRAYVNRVLTDAGSQAGTVAES